MAFDGFLTVSIGDRVEVIRCGRILYVGTVVEYAVDEDDAYGKDHERVLLAIPELGNRSFERWISHRGVATDWQARAKDLRRLGRLGLRRKESQ